MDRATARSQDLFAAEGARGPLYRTMHVAECGSHQAERAALESLLSQARCRLWAQREIPTASPVAVAVEQVNASHQVQVAAAWPRGGADGRSAGPGGGDVTDSDCRSRVGRSCVATTRMPGRRGLTRFELNSGRLTVMVRARGVGGRMWRSRQDPGTQASPRCVTRAVPAESVPASHTAVGAPDAPWEAEGVRPSPSAVPASVLRG